MVFVHLHTLRLMCTEGKTVYNLYERDALCGKPKVELLQGYSSIVWLGWPSGFGFGVESMHRWVVVP